MPDQLFRDSLPEDTLSDLQREVRASKFEEFLRQMRLVRGDRSAGYEQRTAAKHLPDYLNRRLALLEISRRYVGLVRRSEEPLGGATAKLKGAPGGWKKYASSFGDLIAADAKIAIRSNVKQTRKLVEKILAEASVMDILLTDVRVAKNSVLRPSACLTQGAIEEEREIDPVSDDAPRIWLDSRRKTIKVNGAVYRRNGLADAISQMKTVTPNQRDAAVLQSGYGMPYTVLGKLIHRHPKSAYDRYQDFRKALTRPKVKREFTNLLAKHGITKDSKQLQELLEKVVTNRLYGRIDGATPKPHRPTPVRDPLR